MVAMQAHAALLTGMPADGQAFRDHRTTARAHLAGERRINCNHSSTGACCLVAEDGQECRPSRIGNTLGEVVALDHAADLQILVIDRVILSNERSRRLMAEIRPLATYFLMRLGDQDNRFLAAVAALLAARDSPLCRFERAFGLAMPTGVKGARHSTG
jgi:hypothetical protein